MIGFIIISALLLCGVITLLAILFMRPSEVPISDKSIDLSAVLPIQTITDSVIVNGSGDFNHWIQIVSSGSIYSFAGRCKIYT